MEPEQTQPRPAGYRLLVLSLGVNMLGQALNFTQSKYGQNIPDFLIIGLFLGSFILFFWWVVTHPELIGYIKGKWLAHPLATFLSSVFVTIVIMALAIPLCLRGWRFIARNNQPTPSLQVSNVASQEAKATTTSNQTSPPTVQAAPVVKLIFKDSPLFTEQRKYFITRTVDEYYRYLTGIGFEPPDKFPPLRIMPGKTTGYVSQSPGTIYDEYIGIGRENLNNPEKLRSIYSIYIFDNLLLSNRRTDKIGSFRSSASYIFSSYYLCSFSNKKPSTSDKWTASLWEIRNKYGKQFADNALFYSFKTWEDPLTESQLRLQFDAYFANRLRYGIDIAANDFQRDKEVADVLRAHGIQLE